MNRRRPASPNLITLTTDFGATDWFAGTLKGVILRINPKARIVDITHGIPPGDLRAGAFALRASCRFFPKHTVHVVIVDPGVGGTRRAIAVRTARAGFVGPDNGVLSWALARERILSIRELENERLFLKPVSRTFHGRDCFAPVAAHLSRGGAWDQLGPERGGYVQLPWPEPIRRGAVLRGEIIYVDRFGNAITNLDAGSVGGGPESLCEVVGKRRTRCRLAECYGAVPAGRPVAVIGSSDLLEIAVNGGSASRQFELSVGEAVRVHRRPAPDLES